MLHRARRRVDGVRPRTRAGAGQADDAGGLDAEGATHPKAATPAPATPAPNAKPGDAPPPKSGGLEKADAEADAGNIVTVSQDKKEVDGTITKSIGHGKKAHYDATTGDIIL